jgi:hypothetical protein
MKALFAVAAVGLSLIGSMGSVSAQPGGGPDYGYRERDEGYGDRGPRYREREGYGERGPRYREREYRERESGERGRGYRERDTGFNEREYLRCNPDVAQAIRRGQMQSGAIHYQGYGRREGRRLSC